MKQSVDKNNNLEFEIISDIDTLYFDYLFATPELMDLYEKDFNKVCNGENIHGVNFKQIGKLYQCKDYEFSRFTGRLNNGERIAYLKLQCIIDHKETSLLIPRKNIAHNYKDPCLTIQSNVLYIQKNLKKIENSVRIQRACISPEKQNKQICLYVPENTETTSFILSEEQGQIMEVLTIEETGMLLGVAGAGKTHIGIRLLGQFFEQNPDYSKSSAYLVSQPRVKGQVQAEWVNLWGGNPPDSILFLTIHELMTMYLSEALDISLKDIDRYFVFLNKQDFDTWYTKNQNHLLSEYRRLSKVHGNIPDFEKIKGKPETIYDLMVSIAGLSKKDFIDLGTRRCSYDRKCREVVFDILEKWTNYCNLKQIDLRTFRMTLETWKKKFGLIVLDEFQTEGLSFLINASEMAEKIIYCGDGHQTLENRNATIQNLCLYLEKNGKKPAIKVLRETFRNPPRIAALANHCLHGKHLTNGTFNKYEANKIISARPNITDNSSVNKGNVFYLHPPQAEAIEAFAAMTTHHRRGVIVLDEQHLAAARKIFPNEEGIYTVDQIRGTDFDNVYIYLPLSRIHAASKAIIRLNKGNAASDWDDVLVFWNALLICITRAKNNVYIINPDPAAIQNVLTQFFSEAILEGEAMMKLWIKEETTASTREELLERVKDTLGSDIEKAKSYFLSCKLGTEKDFELLCQEMGIRTATSLTVEDTKPTLKELSNNEETPKKSLTTPKKPENKTGASERIASVMNAFSIEGVLELFDEGLGNELLFNGQEPKSYNLLSILSNEMHCTILNAILTQENYMRMIDAEKCCRCLITMDKKILDTSQSSVILLRQFIEKHPKAIPSLFSEFIQGVPQTSNQQKPKNKRKKVKHSPVNQPLKLNLAGCLFESKNGGQILLTQLKSEPKKWIPYLKKEWFIVNMEVLSTFYYGHEFLLECSKHLSGLADYFSPELLIKSRNPEVSGSELYMNLLMSLPGLAFFEKILNSNTALLKGIAMHYAVQSKQSLELLPLQKLNFTNIGTRIAVNIDVYTRINKINRIHTVVSQPTTYPQKFEQYLESLLEFTKDSKNIYDLLAAKHIDYDNYYFSVWHFMMSKPNTRIILFNLLKKKPALISLLEQSWPFESNIIAYDEAGKEIGEIQEKPKTLISHIKLQEESKYKNNQSETMINIDFEWNVMLDFAKQKAPSKLIYEQILPLNNLLACGEEGFRQGIRTLLANDAFTVNQLFNSMSDDPNDSFLARIFNDEKKYPIFRKAVIECKAINKFNPEKLRYLMACFEPFPNLMHKYYFLDFLLLHFDYNKMGGSIFLFTENMVPGFSTSVLSYVFRRVRSPEYFKQLFFYLLQPAHKFKPSFLANFIIHFSDIWCPANQDSLAQAVRENRLKEMLFYNFSNTPGRFENKSKSIFGTLLEHPWGCEALLDYYEKHGKHDNQCLQFINAILVQDRIALTNLCSTLPGQRLFLAFLKDGNAVAVNNTLFITRTVNFLAELTSPLEALMRSPDGLQCLKEILCKNADISNLFSVCSSVMQTSLRQCGYALWHVMQFTHAGNTIKSMKGMKIDQVVWSLDYDNSTEIMQLCMDWLYFAKPNKQYDMLTSKEHFLFGKYTTILDFLLSTGDGIKELEHFLGNHPHVLSQFTLKDVMKSGENILEGRKLSLQYIDFYRSELCDAKGKPLSILFKIIDEDFINRSHKLLIKKPLLEVVKKTEGFEQSISLFPASKIRWTINPLDVCYLSHIYHELPYIGNSELVKRFIYSFFNPTYPKEKILAAEKMLFEKFTMPVMEDNTLVTYHNQTVFGWLIQFDWGCELLMDILEKHTLLSAELMESGFLNQLSGDTPIYQKLCKHVQGLELFAEIIEKFEGYLDVINKEEFFGTFQEVNQTISPVMVFLESNPAFLLKIVKVNPHLMDTLVQKFPATEKSTQSRVVEKICLMLSDTKKLLTPQQVCNEILMDEKPVLGFPSK